MFGWLTDSPIFNLIAPQVKTKEEQIIDSIVNGDLVKFEELKYSVNIHDISKKQNKLLHMACYYGHLDIIKSLLQQSCDINEYGGNGNTPLHFASSRGHRGIVEFLLANGANVNLKNSEGKIPYDMCPIASLKQLLVTYMYQKPNNTNNPANISNTQSTPISPPPTEFGVNIQPIPSQLYTAYPTPASGNLPNYELRQDLCFKFKNEPPSPVSIENYSNQSPITYEPQNPDLPSISPLCPPDNITTVQYNSTSAYQPTPVYQSTPVYQQPPVYQPTYANLPTPQTSPSPSYQPFHQHIQPYNSLSFMNTKKSTPKRYVVPDGFISSANDKKLQEKYGNNVQPVQIAPPPSNVNFL